MFAFEETSHATAATGAIESLSFNEEAVLTTQYTTKLWQLLELWHQKTQFRNLIELQIDRANTVHVIIQWSDALQGVYVYVPHPLLVSLSLAVSEASSSLLHAVGTIHHNTHSQMAYSINQPCRPDILTPINAHHKPYLVPRPPCLAPMQTTYI